MGMLGSMEELEVEGLGVSRLEVSCLGLMVLEADARDKKVFCRGIIWGW